MFNIIDQDFTIATDEGVLTRKSITAGCYSIDGFKL